MTSNHAFYLYAAVMLLAGLGIPVMAALNGGLGTKLQNPALATTILFVVGGLLSIVYLVVSGSLPKSVPGHIPVYYYFGGTFVIFYILTITWVAPKFGVGNAVSFVLLGQIVSMAVIDHFRLFGAPYNPVNLVRFAGLVLMAIGIFLAVRR